MGMPYSDEFWTGSSSDKSSICSLADDLETRAKTKEPMKGFNLENCQLEGVNLVNRGCQQGFDMSESDLYRADLRYAHLFALNLSNSSLMKADLRGANLHGANLSGCNLLGVKFDGAKLEHIEWGEKVLQERLGLDALKRRDRKTGLDYIEQAEEIYRNLRLSLERDGLFEKAGFFFYREMVMRRLQMPYWSIRRFASKLVDLFSGYGEKPLKVVMFSVTTIFCCSILYFLLGISSGSEPLGLSLKLDVWQNMEHFFTCIYFSVVTFTTLGYGDIIPTGFVRPLAAIEAFMGSFTMALFVVVFVKKMTR